MTVFTLVEKFGSFVVVLLCFDGGFWRSVIDMKKILCDGSAFGKELGAIFNPILSSIIPQWFF